MIKSLGIAYKQCLGQSCNRKAWSLTVGLKKMISFSFTMLLVVWLMVSFVLNKSFTSLLLNTYFNVKTIPFVQSLEDIRKNQEILISGHSNYLMAFNKDFKEFHIGDLIERLRKDQDNFPDAISSPRIAEKVINSKSVFITNSFIRELFLLQNKYYHDKFVIANKYYQQIMLFHVNKKQPFAQDVYY